MFLASELKHRYHSYLLTPMRLILVFVMIRGRHRGLPVALDHAVKLPGRKLDAIEHSEGQLRSARNAAMPMTMGARTMTMMKQPYSAPLTAQQSAET